MAAVTSMFRERVGYFWLVFGFIYFLLNCIVNLIDFIVFRHMLGFFHPDEAFLKMFSFKFW